MLLAMMTLVVFLQNVRDSSENLPSHWEILMFLKSAFIELKYYFYEKIVNNYVFFWHCKKCTIIFGEIDIK